MLANHLGNFFFFLVVVRVLTWSWYCLTEEKGIEDSTDNVDFGSLLVSGRGVLVLTNSLKPVMIVGFPPRCIVDPKATALCPYLGECSALPCIPRFCSACWIYYSWIIRAFLDCSIILKFYYSSRRFINSISGFPLRSVSLYYRARAKASSLPNGLFWTPKILARSTECTPVKAMFTFATLRSLFETVGLESWSRSIMPVNSDTSEPGGGISKL